MRDFIGGFVRCCLKNLFDQVAEKIFMEVFFRRTDGHDNEICRNIQLNNELDSLVIDAIEAIAIEDPDHPHKYDIHSVFHNGIPVNWNMIINQCYTATENQNINMWKTIIVNIIYHELIINFPFMYIYSFFHKNYHKAVYEQYKEILVILNNDNNYPVDTENSLISFLSIPNTKKPLSMDELYKEIMRIVERYIKKHINDLFLKSIKDFHKNIHKNILNQLKNLNTKRTFSFKYDDFFADDTYYSTFKKKLYTFTIIINYAPSKERIDRIIKRYTDLFGTSNIDSCNNFAKKYDKLITENKCFEQYEHFMMAIVMQEICIDLNNSWNQSAKRFFIDQNYIPSYYTSNSVFYPELNKNINTTTDLESFVNNTQAGIKRVWNYIISKKFELKSKDNPSYIYGIEWPEILGNCSMVFPSICENFSDLFFSYYLTYQLPQKPKDKDNNRYKFNEVNYFVNTFSNYSVIDQKYKTFLEQKISSFQKKKSSKMLIYDRTDNKNSLFYQVDRLSNIKETTSNQKAIDAKNAYLFYGELISVIVEYALLMYPIDDNSPSSTIYSALKRILSIHEIDYVIDYYNRYKKSQDPNFQNFIYIEKEGYDL